MSKTVTMPRRKPSDGPVSVKNNFSDETVTIEATTNNIPSSLTCGRHNAFRLFGMLALMLEIPLPSSIGKSIKL